MSEVVKFPERPGAAKRREAHEQERQSKAVEQARAQEQRSAHIERAQAAMKLRPMMKSESERRTIARNLWQLLDNIEKGSAGISKAKVLERAAKAKPDDSTKHLARYALPTDLPEAEALKRASQLVQKVRIYVDIATTAAREAKLDEGDVLLQLLQGSSYLAADSAPSSDDPSWLAAEHVAEHIRRAADRLSRHYDLPAFFATLDRHRLVRQSESDEKHDIRGKWAVDVSAHPRALTLPLEIRWSERDRALIHRCPTIHLGIVRADEPVGVGVFEGLFTTEDAHFVALVAEAVPVWEVGLAIGPVGPGGTIAPFLVLHPKTWVLVDAMDLAGQSDAPGDPFEPRVVGEHYDLRAEGRANLLVEDWYVPDVRLRMEDASIFYCGIGDEGLKKARALCDVLRHRVLVPYTGPNLASEVIAEEDQQAPADVSASGSADAEILQRRAELLDQPSVRPAPAIQALPVATETLKRILDRPRLVRHANPNGAEATIWTDERRNGGFLDTKDYPFRDFDFFEEAAPDLSDIKSTIAPEGTLLALIERWVTAKPVESVGPIAALGTLGRDFRPPLRVTTGLHEPDRKRLPLPTPASGLERVLDRAVHYAVTSIDVIMDEARNRLREAARSEPAAAVAPLAETSSTSEPPPRRS